MESYPETLKTRLHDEAYEYRRDAFLAFLKSPVRDYKESPTVKDYVEKSVTLYMALGVFCSLVHSEQTPVYGLSVLNADALCDDP